MKKNKTLLITIPLMLIILGFLLYDNVYLKIRSDIASINESQEIKTKTLEKYIISISEKPHLEKELISLKEERKAENVKIIEGQTFSLAAASLQEMVKGIVTERGGTIKSERVEKPEDLDMFKMISVSIDAFFPDPGVLGDVLYSLETRTPYLTVRELDVRVRNYRDPRELMVKMEVAALTAVQ